MPALVAAFVVQGAAAQVAQEEYAHVAAQAAHTHVPVEIDAALDWSTLISTTLAAHPGSGGLAARTAEAEAWEQRGRQWLAAAPSLYFSYLSDRPLDDLGQREYEGGVELPLWRGGQRSAVPCKP